jgi:ribosomal-protein-serine acetyltransferase
VKGIEESLGNIEGNIEDWEMKTDYHLGIFYDDKMIGMISLHALNYTVNKASIGYWMAKTYEGKGIMTLCVNRLLEYAFEELRLNKVEIAAGVSNLRSRAIPERQGFIEEGVCRDGIRMHGQYIDMVQYGLLRREYMEQKNRNQ